LVAALSLGCAYGIDIGENEFLKFSLFFPILAVGFTALVALAASSASRIQVPGAAILATLAYTIYLTHKPVIALARPWWIAHGIAPQSAGLLLATLVPVIGMALAVHLLVERPLLQSREALIRRLLRRGSGALGVNSRTKRLHLAP
ncbi:MAG: hypothetical protein ACXWPM_12665, partial [Bdellovibrionota bacterium]